MRLKDPDTVFTPSEQVILIMYDVSSYPVTSGEVVPGPNARVAGLNEIKVFGRAAPFACLAVQVKRVEGVVSTSLQSPAAFIAIVEPTLNI
jgi:hypothetical protein